MSVIGQVPFSPAVTAPIPLGAISATSLAALTDEQKASISRGTIVVTPTQSFVYIGVGDKTLSTSYIDIIGSGTTLDSELAAHEADTTNIHGIANTSSLVLTTDSRLSDPRTPLSHTHTKSQITDFSHTHAISDVTNLQTELNNRTTRILFNASGYLPTAATAADQWQATFTIPGGTIGPNGRCSVRIWAACSASVAAKRLRAYVTSTNPGNAIGGTRVCNYNSTASTLASVAVSLMRQFTIINRASQASQIIEPSASGGESATASGDAFEELAINTANTWYLVIGLQKDSTADFLQLKQVLVEVVYAS
ncbi:MAG: hypothetical protein EBU82_10035 [Flavobacteriia bacterium]|nr:hypothetical protein [Flavobacteriia bacterium]